MEVVEHHQDQLLETRQFKDTVLRVNSIVYAPFPGKQPKEEGTPTAAAGAGEKSSITPSTFCFC